ncbi:MAG: type II CAAX endopeptidase family protein [Pseudomonadota bacterium]
MKQIVGVDLPETDAQVSFMSYTRFRPMIESAAARPALWRVVAGLVTVLLVTIFWALGAFLILTAVLGADAPDLFEGNDSPLATVVFLLLIVGLGLGTWLAALLWHRRSFGSLVGRGARLLHDFALAAVITWAVAGVVLLISLPFSDPLQPNLPFREWLAWLPFALLAIFLQTGSEEILFRGYLQSQLAARFRAVWVWMLVPSLMFGALHFLPGETIGPGLVYVASTTFFGIIAADLTARSGNLGTAWGLHFANNCVALLIVVYLGAASGLGLYSAGTIEEALTLSPLLVADVLVMLFLWFLLRRIVTS